MRVMMRSTFDTYTGYGNDAIDIARFLTRRGVGVVPWPDHITPGLPPEFLKLMEDDPKGHYDVTLAFRPPFDIRPSKLAGQADKIVGYTMWERSRYVAQDMEDHGWPKEQTSNFWFEEGEDRDSLDLMIVTNPQNVEALRPLEPHVPYEVVPCGIDPDYWPIYDRSLIDRPVTFGMIGMLSGRKDPFVMLQAWKELKDDYPEFDAHLWLKTACSGLHPAIMDAYPDVHVTTAAWPREKVRDWYAMIDVLVSTSRGEGNNKPAMEFMATGGPVIATDWQGHQNWLRPDTGYPVGGVLAPYGHGLPKTVEDFRVDVGELKTRILEAWGDRTGRWEKGRQSATYIRDSLGWDQVCAKLERCLQAA